MRNKYFYPIFKLKAKSWIRYWLLKKTEFKGKLSEILEGFSFNLQNTLRQKFVKFEIEGNSIQDGEPSPENEVPILSSGDNGSITEKIVNKNLLPNVATSQNKNGIDFTAYDDGTVKANGTSTGYAVITIANIKLPRGNYILNGCPTGGGGSTYLLRTQSGINISNVYDTGSGANISITENSGSADIKLQISPNVTVNNLVFKPMIRLASVSDDTYVEHEEQTYSIYTQQPMRSIGDVRDLFFKNTVDSPYYDENLVENGWYERHDIGTDIYTGASNEAWSYYEGIIFIDNNKVKPYEGSDNRNFLTNYFIPALSKCYLGHSTRQRLHINLPNVGLSNITNVSEWKAWLSTHNLDFQYELQTPTNLPCTQSQIDILENLPITYNEQTNVYSTDEVKPFLKIQYWESDTNG